MRPLFRLLIAAAAAALLLQPPAGAQEAVKQIQLTEKQVQGYIAAQKELSPLIEKLNAAGDKPDPKVEAQVESVVKKHGFASFDEYDDVASNISLVMTGIDPQSKAFTEPPAALKKQIDEIRADKSIKAAEKKQMLDELTAALKTTAPVQFKGNIALVTKYFDQLDTAGQ
jgi:hypothetical protein